MRIRGIDSNRVYKASEVKQLKADGERHEDAPPVIRKIHRRGTEPDPLRGLFAATINGKPAVVEYEPDAELRDTEQIPLQQEGGIEAFLQREVLPWAKDVWYRPDSVKIGYEISFNRYFYQPRPLRTLAEIQADILSLQSEAASLLPDFMLQEPIGEYSTKPRIYVDTSVIGGCEDDEFKEASLLLFDIFRNDHATLVFSEVTRKELENAPTAVRKIAEQILGTHFETLPESDEAQELAEAYISSNSIGPAHYNDALHVAIASLGKVSVIASWNFKHMVSWRRIQAYNSVNKRFGYAPISIKTPMEVYRDQQNS